MEIESPILPPNPPSEEEERQVNIPIRVRGLNSAYKPGEFKYVEFSTTRVMLTSAYQAINLLELWNFIKEDPGNVGFMFSTDNRLSDIYNKIEDLGYHGHSAASFAFTMRAMQFIATEGEEQYRLIYLNNET